MLPELFAQFGKKSLVRQSFFPVAGSSRLVLQVSVVDVIFEMVAESFDVCVVPVSNALHLPLLVLDFLH